MKKLKILPSILMLVLCVGVLAIGVFALAPTQNTISGTITINAANSPVEITMNIKNKAGGDLIGTPKTIRGGHTFTLGDLAFDADEANEVYEVKDIFIEFYIKNLADASDVLAEKQARTLGAFFAESSVTLGDNERATSDDIFTYGSITEGETTYVNIYADSYTPILPQETVKIELQLRMESFETLTQSPLNYKLFIEPYVAKEAIEGEDTLIKLPVTEGGTYLSKGGIPTGTTHIAMPATYVGSDSGNDESLFWNVAGTVVGINIPSNLTGYYKAHLEGFVNLKKVVMPETFAEEARAGYFWNCYILASVTLPSGTTTIPSGLFGRCTSLTKINFDGTVAQWNNITIEDNGGILRVHGGEVRVFCSDGVIVLQTAPPEV